MDFTIFHIQPNFEQLLTTAQFIPNQPVTKFCRLFMIDADYKVVKPFGVIHLGEILQEYLDSSCWNQMDFARKTGIAPKP